MDDKNTNLDGNTTTSGSSSTLNGNHSPPSDINPHLRQKMKTSINMIPHNNQLRNHVIFSTPRFKEVTLSILECDKAIKNKINIKYIDL